ncbi:hypothetical protein [Modestobacter sp. I12A-02662]|uniref:hypothetical protein n=1 Tax=Modestobacter sp. I12A-02662 TaxID=1730496 RepID=UPI0034DEB3C8
MAETTGRFVLRTHAAEVRPFAGLLVRFGKAAVRDVQILDEVLSLTRSAPSEAALGRGWSAVTRLAEKARSLPPGRERNLVGIEVERAMQALLARDADFAIGFTEAIEHAAAQLRAVRAEAAIKAAGTLVRFPAPTEGGKVLARLARRLDAAAPELQRLWSRLEAASESARSIQAAADAAAERAPAILKVLRERGLTSQQRLSQIWGHLSGIRGPLGEGYGLGNRVWLARRAEEMARARALAAAMGPGHTVEYLTQVANNLQVNGREGPDAMLLIVDQRARRTYNSMRAQVKVAAVSEGAQQSGNDVLRSLGVESGRVPVPATVTYTPGPGETPVTLLLSSHPEVRTRLHLINAAGSRIPEADIHALREFGFAIDELQLDLTVTHFTHLALSVAESALDLLKSVR